MDFNTLVAQTKSEQGANRILNLEERIRNRKGIPGDWEGVRAGTWQGFSDSGNGLVKVNGKVYTCVIRASTSIPKGTIVNVAASGGRYIASW